MAGETIRPGAARVQVAGCSQRETTGVIRADIQAGFGHESCAVLVVQRFEVAVA